MLAALQAPKLIPADAHWAAVILSGPMQPDELMAVAASFDQTLRYGAQTPFNDQLAGQWEAGMWEVDSTHNSLVTVANGGTRPARTEFTILYNHSTGHYRIAKELAPDEGVLLDFGHLIRDQISDSDGHALPPDLTMGAYRIKDLSDPGRGSLYEGKVIVEKTYGHAHYGCAECCGVNPEAVSMLYNPLAVGVGLSFGQTVQAPNECEPSDIENITGDFSNWGTDDGSIATVKPAAQVNGIKAGTTTHFASGDVYAGEGHAINHQCPQDFLEPQAGTNVQVPTSLRVVNVSVLPNGSGPPNGCPGSQNYGVKIDIKYQVLDQNGTPIQSASMTPHENGTFFTGGGYDGNIGPVTGYPTSSATTAADGTFHDVPFGICQSLPISSPGLTATQHITIIMPDGSVPGVRTQTFTVTAPGSQSFGHGSISNSIGDISAQR